MILFNKNKYKKELFDKAINLEGEAYSNLKFFDSN